MSDNDYEKARVGDPRIARPRDTMPCGFGDPEVGFGCTRARDHGGQHVAETTTEVVAIWPNHRFKS